jgi:galacturonokinase
MRLLDPATESRAAALREECASIYGRREEDVRVVHAPYRICPLGAHIDHQLGAVSAIALEHGILLAFVPSDEVRVRSRGYPGDVSINLNARMVRRHDWADYARGALFALSSRSIRTGASFLIDGHLGEAGISSSAAIGLGYLLTFSLLNDLELSAAELIELDRVIENDFLGLKNGVLDQSAIALARAESLTVIDCRSGDHRYASQPEPFEFLAVYSGVREPLTGSSRFNDRVEECLEAGAALHALVHGERRPSIPLGTIERSDFEAHEASLPPHLARRARHFFSENARVRRGEHLWRHSDRSGFGALMLESGESSIQSYETGSTEMVRLFELLADIDGVAGARFSGAGFRGCAVALVQPGAAEHVADEVHRRYASEFPQYRDAMWAIRSGASRGLREL